MHLTSALCSRQEIQQKYEYRSSEKDGWGTRRRQLRAQWLPPLLSAAGTAATAATTKQQRLVSRSVANWNIVHSPNTYKVILRNAVNSHQTAVIHGGDTLCGKKPPKLQKKRAVAAIGLRGSTEPVRCFTSAKLFAVVPREQHALASCMQVWSQSTLTKIWRRIKKSSPSFFQLSVT